MIDSLLVFTGVGFTGWVLKIVVLWVVSAIVNLAITYPMYLKFVAKSEMEHDDVRGVILFGAFTFIFCIHAMVCKVVDLGFSLLDEVPNIINRLYGLKK